MKKLIAAALVGTMVLTMAGCGSKTAETTGSEASSDAAGGTLASQWKEYFYVDDYLVNKEKARISSGCLGGQVKYYFDD